MIDLDAIRTRDAEDVSALPILQTLAVAVDDPELRNAIHMIEDRRALLAYVDALRKDAERYRWLRDKKHPSLGLTRLVLNDTPHGIDAAIDAAMGEKP